MVKDHMVKAHVSEAKSRCDSWTGHFSLFFPPFFLCLPCPSILFYITDIKIIYLVDSDNIWPCMWVFMYISVNQFWRQKNITNKPAFSEEISYTKVDLYPKNLCPPDQTSYYGSIILKCQ